MCAGSVRLSPAVALGAAGSLSVSSVLPQHPVVSAKGGAPTWGDGAEAVGPTAPYQVCTGHAALHA